MFVYPSFFHASYAVYIRYQHFHSINVTLHTVTSIRSRQLKNKIQLEPRKQDESCQKIQDPQEGDRKKRERNQVGKEKSLRKRKKTGFKEKVADVPYVKVILILLLKNISSEILHGYIVVNE